MAVILVSSKVRFMRIFAGVRWRGRIKRERGRRHATKQHSKFSCQNPIISPSLATFMFTYSASSFRPRSSAYLRQRWSQCEQWRCDWQVTWMRCMPPWLLRLSHVFSIHVFFYLVYLIQNSGFCFPFTCTCLSVPIHIPTMGIPTMGVIVVPLLLDCQIPLGMGIPLPRSSFS